jgi:hypothetical protein
MGVCDERVGFESHDEGSDGPGDCSDRGGGVRQWRRLAVVNS